MKFEITQNKTANTIFCACVPESVEEINDWYDKWFENSISQYTNVIARIMKAKRTPPLFISFYPVYHLRNNQITERGMAEVLRRYGMHFSGRERTALWCDRKGKSYLISVTDACIEKINIFFHNRVYTILCFADGYPVDDLLDDICLATNREDVLSYLGSKFTVITFNDVGCDGSSMFIQNWNNIHLIKTK